MHRAFPLLGLVLGVLVGACVNTPDPNHCWYRERNATCEGLYGADIVCSRCLRGFNGCIDAAEAPDCEGEDDGSEDESSSESSGD